MEEIDENNMKLSSEQISELVRLLEKEAVIENEQTHKAQTTSSDTSTSALPKEKLKIPLPEDTKSIPPANKNISKTKTNSNSKTLR